VSGRFVVTASVRIAATAAGLLFAGCGSGQRVTILKAALSQNPSEPQVRAVELFADLPPGHPFFEQYSFISDDDLPVVIRYRPQANEETANP